MANKRKNYVSADKIKKIDCDYLLLLGERANGKSYASKSLILSECYRRNTVEFIYLRRFDLDIKDSVAVNYFADMPIYEITNGEYTCVDVFRKDIYFANVDENTGKVVRGRKIGHCHALSGAEHYKSLAFPKVEFIIFEEFISVDGHYLFNEPDKLQHYVSTIFRHKKGKVYLIGNTISRICPYYREWGLEKGLRSQKQGEVRYYKIDQTMIALYLTDSLNFNSGMFFGNIAKNITKNETQAKSKVTPIVQIIGDNLKKVRLLKNLSLREAGSLLGMSAPAISKYEKGDIIPNSTKLIEFAKAYQVKTIDFLSVYNYPKMKFECFRKSRELQGEKLDLIKRVIGVEMVK